MSARHRLTAFLVTSIALGLTASEGCGKASTGDPEAEPQASSSAPDAARTVEEPGDGPAAADPADDPRLQQFLDLIVRQQQYASARTGLMSYLRESPEIGRAWLLLALTYHKERRYELARPYFDRALALDPGFPLTNYYYGWCLYYLGDTEASRTALTTYLEHDPTEGDAHFAIGLIDLDADRLKEAEQRFHTAIELQIDNPRAIKNVAAAYMRLGDVQTRRDDLPAARRELETAARMFPDLYAAHLKLARVLRRLGENELAEAAMLEYEAALQRVRPRKGFPE